MALVDPAGNEFARGLTNYAMADIARIKGLRTEQIAAALGHCPYVEVIHRDNMALTTDAGGSARRKAELLFVARPVESPRESNLCRCGAAEPSEAVDFEPRIDDTRVRILDFRVPIGDLPGTPRSLAAGN